MSIKSEITKKTLKNIMAITKTKLTLGKFLWAIRQSDELSQVDFAKKLGMTKQQLCDIERNRKIVSPKLAKKYAEILGYSSEQFIRLALQDLVDRDRLNVTIEVSLTRKKSDPKELKWWMEGRTKAAKTKVKNEAYIHAENASRMRVKAKAKRQMRTG